MTASIEREQRIFFLLVMLFPMEFLMILIMAVARS